MEKDLFIELVLAFGEADGGEFEVSEGEGEAEVDDFCGRWVEFFSDGGGGRGGDAITWRVTIENMASATDFIWDGVMVFGRGDYCRRIGP